MKHSRNAQLNRCYSWCRIHEPVYTIGHSAHSFEEFAALLIQHGIHVVADTRSAPYSRFAPQFDREVMQRTWPNRASGMFFWATN